MTSARGDKLEPAKPTAIAYQQVATQGRLVTETDVLRVVDAVGLPAIGRDQARRQSPAGGRGQAVRPA